MIANTKIPTVEQTSVKLTDADHGLLEKRLLEKNEKYKLFDNREKLTYVNKKPSNGELKIIDAIIKTYLGNLKDARDINPAAFTIKEHLKRCKVRKSA